MSNKKDKELNDKNKETKNLFANLKQYRKKDIEEDNETGILTENQTDKGEEKKASSNIYMSLLEDNKVKEEYIGATHYFRPDQLKDLDKFSKDTNKLKNQFMRELFDLVFAQLKKGSDGREEKATGKPSDRTEEVKQTSPSANPFEVLLEVNESKKQYVRATHYFRQDQLDDLDKFVEKSGKSKNEFVRDTIDLVFSELRKVNS